MVVMIGQIEKLLGLKGVLAIAMLIIGTGFVFMSKMTVDQWTTYCQWIFGIFAGSTAVTASAAHLAMRGQTKAMPPATPDPTSIANTK